MEFLQDYGAEVAIGDLVVWRVRNYTSRPFLVHSLGLSYASTEYELARVVGVRKGGLRSSSYVAHLRQVTKQMTRGGAYGFEVVKKRPGGLEPWILAAALEGEISAVSVLDRYFRERVGSA